MHMYNGSSYEDLIKKLGVSDVVTYIPSWKAYKINNKWKPTQILKLKLHKLTTWSLLTFKSSNESYIMMKDVNDNYEHYLELLIEKLNQGVC